MADDQLENTASADARAKAEKAKAARRELLEQSLRRLMSDPDGRVALWHLLGMCHLFGVSYRVGQPDAAAFLEGERNVGLRLIADLRRTEPLLFASFWSEMAMQEELHAAEGKK